MPKMSTAFSKTIPVNVFRDSEQRSWVNVDNSLFNIVLQFLQVSQAVLSEKSPQKEVLLGVRTCTAFARLGSAAAYQQG
jgi:hypothetical protein